MVWVVYSATGTATISADDLTNEEVIEAFENFLSNELNIHPSNIEVTYDIESGMVTYDITSDDIEDVDNAITIISQDDFVTNLRLMDAIEIESIEPPTEVLVTIDAVVDASNVDDVSLVTNDVIELIRSQDENYNVNSEGN